MKNNIAKLRHFAFTNNMSKHKTIDLYMLDPKQRGFKTGCQKFLLKIRWSFQVWVSSRVSVQGVKSLGGHFACLCQGFEFYEVKKKKMKILLHF